MSRPESEIKPTFKIAKEETHHAPGIGPRPGLSAVPLSLRKHSIAEFDHEIQNEAIKQRTEQRFVLAESARRAARVDAAPEIAECIANARHLLREKEFELAESLFRAALKMDAHNEVGIRGLAECARAQNQHEEAIKVLKTLVVQNGSSENLKLLGDELFGLEYNQDALEVYMRALAHPKIDESLLFGICKNVGNLFLRLGDTDAAEEYYNKAYTLDPDSDVLLVNFGSLALFRGQLDKALARFREAVTINDQNDKGWVGLAMIHREYGDSDLAWANVEKALDIAPQNESAIKLVAEWALKDNEVEKAIRRIEAFLQKQPENAQMSMWLAKFYYFSCRLDAAVVEMEKAIYLNPDLEGAMDVLSVIRSEIQEREAKQK